MKILAIGSHPDDVEIGCGGSLIKHRALKHSVKVLVLTGGGRGGDGDDEDDLVLTRFQEAKNAADLMDVDIDFFDYADTEIPGTHDVIARIEELVAEFKPDRVYIPFEQDSHQDHRNTSRVAKAACRKVKQILEYEEPSSYSTFNANFWIDITPHIEKKLEAIKLHVSQGHKEILKAKSIEGLNLYRGYQSHVQYAEGFSTFRYLE
ncbi:PIG-L family deacetylase [Candidatus Kaiserbacteria bacterium]|nr:PIG-L family deacetylase [Candidatus Kaiserbacteria bacterium]USN91823.1 MAG: PIG-L family deacetylase [Candidatus Nomurabacteria bacterium]